MSNAPKSITVQVITETALINLIASKFDMDMRHTIILEQVVSVAKLPLSIGHSKEYKFNTVALVPWEISNGDVTRARNYILEKLDLDLKM